ncbi:MAG: DUF3343 domain-containing protein [Clostridia bacterium]|nr:DUF3343 domain-containing protein [Clostridia bacterium]
MRHLILAFRSRSQASRLYDRIKNYANARLIPTPTQIYPECSLSVKTDEGSLSIALSLVKSERLNTFIGAFIIDETAKTIQKVSGFAP